MTDDLRIKTRVLIARARQTQLADSEGDWRSMMSRLADRLEAVLEMDPPDGWFTFGSHAGQSSIGLLEFSDELDEFGLPRWERHVQATPERSRS